MHSSFAFHWLSEVPKEVLIKDSPSWNKGKILYVTAPDEVAEAYAAQFAKDFDSILNARAKELVKGGMMLSLTMGFPYDNIELSKEAFGLFYDALGSSLLDMAHEGLVDESQVDSFNIPLYATSPREVEGLVAKNGCFSIEQLKFVECGAETNRPIATSLLDKQIRAVLEGPIIAHFGGNIIDKLFERFSQKATVLKNVDLTARRN